MVLHVVSSNEEETFTMPILTQSCFLGGPRRGGGNTGRQGGQNRRAAKPEVTVDELNGN